MRSLPDPKSKKLAYSAAQAYARTLIKELTAHLDEHAEATAQYPLNLTYSHAEYIDEIGAMLNSIVLHTKGESDKG